MPGNFVKFDLVDGLSPHMPEPAGIARAPRALHRGQRGVGKVPMRPCLVNLCASLNAAFFHGSDTIAVEVSAISLGRDRAIAIGLVVNELCPNAAKHAFPE